MQRPIFLALICLSLAACAAKPEATPASPEIPVALNLHPGETPEIRNLIKTYATKHEIPETLLHRVIQRESDYRADARNGPYYGLMQILPATARSMGFQGQPSDLLNPATNLEYAGRYLRGAWLLSNGDEATAVGWYARGYYYEARDRCMLRATGLAQQERC